MTLTYEQLLEQRDYLIDLVVDLHKIANMPDHIKKQHDIMPVLSRSLDIVGLKIEGKHDDK